MEFTFIFLGWISMHFVMFNLVSVPVSEKMHKNIQSQCKIFTIVLSVDLHLR